MLSRIAKSLLYEAGQLSLTRVLTIASFALFAAGTGYLLLSAQTWQHYDTFATLTAGGGLATQLGNKIVNSRYNSDQGQFPDKQGGK